jgi:hypothetical protein
MCPSGPSPVRLQILLRKESRTPEGRRRVEEACRTLDLETTGVGVASLSARASSAAYQRLFGGVPPGEAALTTATLPVPEVLRADVESITLSPPHILFRDGKGGDR